MKLRTAVVATGLVLALTSAAVVGLTGGGPALQEQWVSDTPRDDRRNHHAVGVGPEGIIVAPVTTIPGSGSLVRTSCALVRLASEDGSVRWQNGVPPENCTSHALTQPAIGDIDGDGETEVAASTTEQVLRVHSAATGDEEWRVPLTTYGYSQPALGNLKGDADPELVASDIRGGVVAVDDGDVLWRHALGGLVWADPSVDDINGDGTVEVLVASAVNTTLLSPNGTVEWVAAYSGESLATAPGPDGTRRAFVAETGSVTALDGATGRPLWTHEIEGIPSVHAVGDGRLYVGISRGKILALDVETGDTVWSYRFPSTERRPTPPPAVGDVDGDGDLEVVAVDSTGEVALLDAASGSQRSTYSRDVPIWTFPTVADVDDDGDAEVFVRYGDGRVVALEAV